MRKSLIILLLLLIIPFAHAKTGHLTLLTVGGNNESTGGTADLYLEIRPGKGTIFIDSFPLTKLDTQISTRYANEIACDFLEEDCSKYDFFYTIRAKASIVGGPSAGAAITLLTITTLSDVEIDDKTTITGTINSGGVIGPVAGISQKINAAIDNGFTKVLVPKWQSTINVTDLEKKNVDEKITIVKVKNLEEALYHFTGKDYSIKETEFEVPKDFQNQMKQVSEELCSRSEEIKSSLNYYNQSQYNIAIGFLNQTNNSIQNEDYYATASYCFSANLRLRSLQYENLTQVEKANIYFENKKELTNSQARLDDKELKTISDLQTFMIVQERLNDAKEYLGDVDELNISSTLIAFAEERIFSANIWASFFDIDGEVLDLNEDHLREGCLKKLGEAEERVNYAELYLPGFLEPTKQIVNQGFDYLDNEHYELCIFEASKAKAEANILLTAISIQEEDIESIVDEKLEAIKKIIIRQENLFPILGYSYYEYSNSLKNHNPASALTFAEYGLEMSNLDMYFPKENYRIYVDYQGLQIFGFGFIVGACVVILFNIGRKKK